MNQTSHGYYEYLSTTSFRLFTAVMLPNATDTYPTLLIRTPYVANLEPLNEEQIIDFYLDSQAKWLQSGYAVVIQHCRGCGKSDGEFIPYINEREDGLALQAWVRSQPFYNGELYLYGSSYLSSVHYTTAPFAADIKGAIFGVQDTERYNICYRNGFLKSGLHANWFSVMYKQKTLKNRNYVPEALRMLPLSDYCETVFGEPADVLNAVLKNPNRNDPHWSTQWGGSDARDAVKNPHFPILFTTGFYDIYTGGIFTMWKNMDPAARSRCALVVSPYDHGDNPQPIVSPNGKRTEYFGENYEIQWMNYIRGMNQSPFVLGNVTYYSLFENQWKSDNFQNDSQLRLRFGEKTHSYVYNPYAPPSFPGGLCCNFDGAAFQDPPNSRYDIISVYSEPFAEDTLVKGRMTGALQVSSDCADTCFYARLSITTENGDYGLRDDITSLCKQYPDYVPGSVVPLSFTFDEHAFLIQKGARIRLDIASADAAHYVPHTNKKGLYSIQTTAKIAHNTVFLKESYVDLPVVNL